MFQTPNRLAATGFQGRCQASCAALTMLLFSTTGCWAAAAEDREAERERMLRSSGLVQFTFDRSFRVRGWQVLPNVYFGQAKIANEWGVGFLVEREGYAYGINNERLSFVMRW